MWPSSDLLDWIGLALVALVSVHVALDWRWLADQTGRLLATPRADRRQR